MSQNPREEKPRIIGGIIRGIENKWWRESIDRSEARSIPVHVGTRCAPLNLEIFRAERNQGRWTLYRVKD